MQRILGFCRRSWPFLLGLVAVVFYWILVHPPGHNTLGYSEDYCVDLARQFIAEKLQAVGRPEFHGDAFMTPKGTSLGLLGWGLERDWVGAYFWMWLRDFPFYWAYFGISLLVCYLGSGFIMKKMSLPGAAAWGLAALVTVFNLPRHFKTYYHFEHTTQHWVYLSIFVDAWLWSRLWRERRYSLNLEAWRGVCLLGMMGTTGTYWGPLVLEWLVVRFCALFVFALAAIKRNGIRFEAKVSRLILPLALCLFWAAIDFIWLSPLVREVSALGKIHQPISWYGNITMALEPLWLGFIVPGLTSITIFETIITVGWVYWLPALFVLVLLPKKLKGPGIGVVAPFLIFLLLIVRFMTPGEPYVYRDILQAVIPFMSFFRVACRMAMFFPPLLIAVVAVAWPELSAFFRRAFQKPGVKRYLWSFGFGLFGIMSAAEVSWLSHPISAQGPIDPSVTKMMKNVKAAPGSSVLDLPFCVAGGNGMCTGFQCPQYPRSVVGQCFRTFHEKKVYGLYAARLVESQCRIYSGEPFDSLFSAWRDNRCLSELDWDQLCAYLESAPEISAVLLYPDIWTGSGSKECLERFARHLGEPVESASYIESNLRASDRPSVNQRILRYRTKCLQSRKVP